MAPITTILFLAIAFFIITVYFRFVYTPLKSRRDKRRVRQDANARPPVGHSPFVEIDVRLNQESVEQEEEVEIVETAIENSSQDNSPNIISISENPDLAAPPSPVYVYNLRKHSVDISNMSKNIIPHPSTNNTLFHQTNVLIN